MRVRTLGVSDGVRRTVKRAFEFGLVAGIGLALDYVFFLLLLEGGLRAGWANLVSAGAAVTFVYFVSVRRIFAYEGQFLIGLFAMYSLFQAGAVVAASWSIDWLVSDLHMAPVWGKTAILPITFSANFLFMTWLTRAKQS